MSRREQIFPIKLRTIVTTCAVFNHRCVLPKNIFLITCATKSLAALIDVNDFI